MARIKGACTTDLLTNAAAFTLIGGDWGTVSKVDVINADAIKKAMKMRLRRQQDGFDFMVIPKRDRVCITVD